MTSGENNRSKKSVIKIVALVLTAAIVISVAGIGIYFSIFKGGEPEAPNGSGEVTEQHGALVGKFTDREIKDDASAILAVKDVAEESGFSDRSQFCTAFKKHTGFTPLEYRRRKA